MGRLYHYGQPAQAAGSSQITVDGQAPKVSQTRRCTVRQAPSPSQPGPRPGTARGPVAAPLKDDAAGGRGARLPCGLKPLTGDWRRLAAGASTARIEAALKANAAGLRRSRSVVVHPILGSFTGALVGGMILRICLCVPRY
jgi:hypothetical protein